jgi:acyl carrier protein
MRDVQAAVVDIINNVCRPEKPDLSDPDRSLIGDGLDSLDFASVLIAIEDEFGLSVSEKDMEGLGSLNALVAYVEKHRKS